MLFRKVQTTTFYDVCFDSIKINQVTTTKFLGVEIDADWHNHIAKIEKKVACAVGIIGKAHLKLTNATSLLLMTLLLLRI